MGLETMATGEIQPLDICYNCLWYGFKYNLAQDEIYLGVDHE